MSRGARKTARGVQSGVQVTLRSGLRSQDPVNSEVGGVGTTDIMASSFASRDDPEYLKTMEDELIKSREAREQETALLASLVSRMDKWEAKSVSAGRGILHTPLRGVHLPHTTPGLNKGLSFKDSVSSQLFREDTSGPAPSDIINGPLTSVLQQLSVAIDPTPQASVKGLLLRPEYYVQHKDKGTPVKNLDHTKLSFKELMSGMGRVMLHLSKTGGNVSSYIGHFSFMTRKAGAHTFNDLAYVGYDRHVVDQFINGESEEFVAGDLFGIALHFHAGNLAQPKAPFPFPKQGRGRGFRRGGRPGWFESDRQPGAERESITSSPPLEGFPEDICFNYNYKSCSGSCKKSHVCRLCRGPHKASSSQCQPSKK